MKPHKQVTTQSPKQRKRKERCRVKRLDRYIVTLFLGTFLAAIGLILSVSVIFDINEKIDKFLNPDCSLYEIIFHYYVNFIPYYAVLFSPLFVFISVIFFTTQLAQKSEIIAILAGGVSFRRLLRPYLFSATVIAIFTLLLNSFVIPPGNRVRNEFQNTYIKDKRIDYAETIQLELAPHQYLYMRYFSATDGYGVDFSIDKFENGTLRSRLEANRAEYKEGYRWLLGEGTLTRFGAKEDTLLRFSELDTLFYITPQDFLATALDAENLSTPRLIGQINSQRERGAANVKLFEVELHKRIAAFFAAYILTLIGVSLSVRKRKGGMGLALALGIALSFTYIVFMTISSSFAISGALSPMLAAELPNIVYAIIALVVYRLFAY